MNPALELGSPSVYSKLTGIYHYEISCSAEMMSVRVEMRLPHIPLHILYRLDIHLDATFFTLPSAPDPEERWDDA